MTLPLPPASLWEQFGVIGVLALILILIGVGARKLFLDFIAWQAKQDEKRDQEREKQGIKQDQERENQRVWQERMEEKAETSRKERDVGWQGFFAQVNEDNSKSLGQMSEVHEKLVTRMDALTTVITRMSEVQEKLVTRMDGLTTVITEHDGRTHKAVAERPAARRTKLPNLDA